MYFMQWDDRYVVGSYRHEPVIVDPELIDDSRIAPADLDFDESVFVFRGGMRQARFGSRRSAQGQR